MGYTNIFQQLDRDIANQLQHLQIQQKELLDKKKNLSNTKQEIQKFLSSAHEIQKLIESEPEVIKSLRTELGQIFVLNNVRNNNNHVINAPQLPINQPEAISTNVEQPTQPVSPPEQSMNLEEESINDFNFVDAKGKNTLTTSEV